MADDLVASGHLKSLDRRGTIELLGPETETEKWKNWDLVYWLGPERGYFSIDSEWLVIRFGSDGRAKEVSIVRD